MNKTLIAIATAAAFFAPAAMAVNASHVYLLNQSLADQMGGPSLVASGGSVTSSGYQFGGNQGLSLSNVLTNSDYTINMSFSFEQLSGYRKIIDFKDLSADAGLYNLDTALNFYPVTTGPANAFAANTPVSVTLTRTTAGLVTGYVNGIQQISFDDSATTYATFSGPNSIAHFFQDDTYTGHENSAGVASYIRIYDTALNSSEVAGLGAPVPEPETYALMLAGLGLVGFAARRRQAS